MRRFLEGFGEPTLLSRETAQLMGGFRAGRQLGTPRWEGAGPLMAEWAKWRELRRDEENGDDGPWEGVNVEVGPKYAVRDVREQRHSNRR